jgi:hypothetical protein
MFSVIYLRFTSQTIKRDFQKNHPAVLEKFCVNADDRKYQIWQRNPLSVDLWTKEVFIQKMEYIHYNLPTSRQARWQQAFVLIRKIINIPRQIFMKQKWMNLVL